LIAEAEDATSRPIYLANFASTRGLKLTVKVEVESAGGVSQQMLDEKKSALRERRDLTISVGPLIRIRPATS
jgi:hypothetical protein